MGRACRSDADGDAKATARDNGRTDASCVKVEPLCPIMAHLAVLLVVVQHAQQGGHLAGGIGDNGVLDLQQR